MNIIIYFGGYSVENKIIQMQIIENYLKLYCIYNKIKLIIRSFFLN